MNIRPTNSSQISPGYEGSGKLPPGGNNKLPELHFTPTPLPQVTREDLDAAKNPTDSVSIGVKHNNSHSASPPTLNPDATPTPLPYFPGGLFNGIA